MFTKHCLVQCGEFFDLKSNFSNAKNLNRPKFCALNFKADRSY